MVATVEVDEKGRLRLPARLRRELNTQRFTLRIQNGRIALEPIKHPSKVRGKYKGTSASRLGRPGEDSGVPGFKG